MQLDLIEKQQNFLEKKSVMNHLTFPKPQVKPQLEFLNLLTNKKTMKTPGEFTLRTELSQKLSIVVFFAWFSPLCWVSDHDRDCVSLVGCKDGQKLAFPERFWATKSPNRT